MKQRIVKSLLAASLTLAMVVGTLPAASLKVQAATDLADIVDENLTIEASKINQWLTKDLKLPTSISGVTGEKITYSVGKADPKYVSVVDNKRLKITRPYAGEDNYTFTLYATVEANGETYTKEFPLTIWAGLSEDSYAGYVYVSFAVNKANNEDVQQIHFFLSEDGLNWTALNGCNPAFLAGEDYADDIVKVSQNNYEIASGVDETELAKTVTGDASVLYPFEGDDQGVRDPYLIRGCKADGSDANKVWLLATDLNTHDEKYGGVKENDKLGNWGETTQIGKGSTNLFIWETEDWVHWTRRYVDVASAINGGMAWAPEAIYNPEKNNYLVYWSARTSDDGRARDRLYCNETSDFVTFGPTKLYEQEPFYKNYLPNGQSNNSGYGNIDTSQLWVPEKDENGRTILNEDGSIKNPYGTLYRLVKDETNNHIELQSAKTVLDPSVDYDASKPHKITSYTLDGTAYDSLEALEKLTGDKNQIKTAEIVNEWFKNNSVGNHFTKISQTGIEQYKGAYEGATMFKFIDRDEWCVMIDYYGNMTVRYEPYLTTDLSEPNSIQKAASGTYGRTNNDIGTHGGMIPITVEEYNALVDTYNADTTVNNYHPIKHIQIDKRALTDKSAELKAAAETSDYSSSVIVQMKALADKADALSADEDVTTAMITNLTKRADKLLANKKQTVPSTPADTVKEAEIVLDAGETVTDLPAVNSTHTVGKVNYKITKVDEYNTDGTNGTVTVTGMTNKKAKSVVIPDEVEIEGYTFAVDKINAKAFYKCSKLKTITLGDNVKSIGKQAFKGIHKKAVFKVSSDNYTRVKKALKRSVGFKKPMKLKEV